jgi:hypothetical protein
LPSAGVSPHDVILANPRPDHDHYVCPAVESVHCAAGEPFYASRKVVKRRN